MGTFHRDGHPLHGITCAVDTRGPLVYVGRVDGEEPEGLVLLDADVHEDRPGGPTKAEYLRRAAAVGHFPRRPRVVVPASAIASVTRLGDIPPFG